MSNLSPGNSARIPRSAWCVFSIGMVRNKTNRFLQVSQELSLFFRFREIHVHIGLWSSEQILIQQNNLSLAQAPKQIHLRELSFFSELDLDVLHVKRKQKAPDNQREPLLGVLKIAQKKERKTWIIRNCPSKSPTEVYLSFLVLQLKLYSEERWFPALNILAKNLQTESFIQWVSSFFSGDQSWNIVWSGKMLLWSVSVRAKHFVSSSTPP